MPIEFKEFQTVIHCRGDIAVLPFSPKTEACGGVAWLLLQERDKGKVGRPVPEEGVICLPGQPGVLVAADDPQSLDVIIEALERLRDDLAELQAPDISMMVPAVQEYESSGGSLLVSGLRFSSTETLKVKGKGDVKVCRWPENFPAMAIAGKVVVIDGSLYEVLSVEFGGEIGPGKLIGLVVKPYKKQVTSEDEL
jgi:hypothetical protein